MKKTTARQRRPAFDREHGVAIAQALFHARGYDAVSVADLTEALGIVPPSLYAAYGSKLALFERALRSYASTESLQVDEVLAGKKPPAEELTALFVAAAKHYTRDPILRGCMVTEAMRADDPGAAVVASALAEAGNAVIRSYVSRFAAAAHVERITDYVLMTLRGLSSYACLGYSTDKLVDCSKVAGLSLIAEFSTGRAPRQHDADLV
jgi:TetR/AcrR family transcriptional regulator, repressor for divergent bdcA